MNSYSTIGSKPRSLAIPADDVLELHASRLLLLIKYCGVKGNKIIGLTKLAKLDFFVRYPDFFSAIASYLGDSINTNYNNIESRMVRHHYGPWDKRYYHVIGYLESRGLIQVSKSKNTFEFVLTSIGENKVKPLVESNAFFEIIEHMKNVKKTVGKKSGSQLKNLIYEVFEKEVKDRKLGDSI